MIWLQYVLIMSFVVIIDFNPGLNQPFYLGTMGVGIAKFNFLAVCLCAIPNFKIKICAFLIVKLKSQMHQWAIFCGLSAS